MKTNYKERLVTLAQQHDSTTEVQDKPLDNIQYKNKQALEAYHQRRFASLFNQLTKSEGEL